jgi:hypothetical protein
MSAISRINNYFKIHTNDGRLQLAVQKVAQKIENLTREQKIQLQDSNATQLIEQAYQAVSFTPRDGLAFGLHKLLTAPNEDLCQRQKAITEIAFWAHHMEDRYENKLKLAQMSNKSCLIRNGYLANASRQYANAIC